MLGFHSPNYFVGGESNPQLGVTLSCLFEHETGAIAQILQTYIRERKLPITLSIISYWGDEPELLKSAPSLTETPPIAAPSAAATFKAAIPDKLPIYSYATHNRAPSWVVNAFLHPQMMTQRMVGATPVQLWQTHQERRNAVSRVLGPPLNGQSQLALAHTRLLRQVWAVHIRRTNAFKLIFGAMHMGTRQTETLGALEGQVAPAPSQS